MKSSAGEEERADPIQVRSRVRLLALADQIAARLTALIRRYRLAWKQIFALHRDGEPSPSFPWPRHLLSTP